jgi:transposase
LILDNAKYHKGPEVRKWLNGKEDRIELHYLPSYSPKLNAAEYIWKETRRKTTHNRFSKTLTQAEAAQKIQPISGKSCIAEKRA